MSLPILLDKSTFQSLSYNEMIALNNYYLHNISPLLIMEILGDLKKEIEGGDEISNEKVQELSTKLFPYDAVINEHYRELVKADLLNFYIKMDHRPILGNAKIKETESGKIGLHIDVSQDEKNLFRWQKGNFLEVEKEFSSIWRQSTTDKDFVNNLKRKLGEAKPVNKKIRTLDELDNEVFRILDLESFQAPLLLLALKNYEIGYSETYRIFSGWVNVGSPLIKDFAPYVYHCLRVDLFYIIGLQFSLIGERPTNRLDLQYLYYLPFVKIFSSNDKIHKRIAPYFLREDQDFVVGEDFKADLKTIMAHQDGLGDDEKAKTLKKPPIIEDSFTFKMWNKYFDYPPQYSLRGNKPIEWYQEKMKEFENAHDSGKGELENDGDFVVRKSIMRKTDPCPCGSGKAFIDCHLRKQNS